MRIIKFKRFTKPHLLRRVAPGLLREFVAHFAEELGAGGVPLPDPALANEPYCAALAACLFGPEALPARMNEALFAVDEMAGPEAQDRLERVAAEAGLHFAPGSTQLDMALQVWLASPDLLAREHNRQGLLRLSRFEYWGGPGLAGPAEFKRPGEEAIAQLVAALDSWFARHHRGRETARVELYPIEDELWFLVRHGDTYTRASKVEQRRSEVLHFRPERDDVVVFAPSYDELRINARTKGERDLFRQEFGFCLRGKREYFCERLTYTLDPLREAGPEALDVTDLPGLRRIRLREIEVVAEDGTGEFNLRGSADLFEGGSAEEVIPAWGRLTRAAFEVEFADSTKPRPVQIRLPNILKLSRHTDAARLQPWLCRGGFRARRGLSTCPPFRASCPP